MEEHWRSLHYSEGAGSRLPPLSQRDAAQQRDQYQCYLSPTPRAHAHELTSFLSGKPFGNNRTCSWSTSLIPPTPESHLVPHAGLSTIQQLERRVIQQVAHSLTDKTRYPQFGHSLDANEKDTMKTDWKSRSDQISRE